MEIKIADSFWESLKTLKRHETWWYKTYEVFRYKIPMFFENIWYFKKELWAFRSWDHTFNLMLLGRSLEKTANTIEFHGHEVDVTRLKKVEKIKRAVEIIRGITEDDYLDRAQKELGELKNIGGWYTDIEDTPEEREHNRKIFDLSNKIAADEWDELFIILKGQNHEEYCKLLDNATDEEKRKYNLWDKWYDGSGMKHWWD